MKENYISISHWIQESTPSYGDQGGFSRISLSKIKEGNSANSEKWIFNNHLGTHVDFPKHFYDDGLSSSEFQHSFFIFKNIGFVVLEKPASPGQLITVEDLLPQVKLLPKSTEVLLLKTHFEKYRTDDRYWNNNPGFDAKLSLFFRSHFSCLKAFGFDSISLTSINHREMGKKAHKAFLNKINPILIIEDMKLSSLKKNQLFDELYVFPLMIENTDGTPVNCSIKLASI